MTKHTRNQTTNQGRGRGRPRQSDAFRVVPVPHTQVDPRKLGRAIVALVLHQREEQESAQSREVSDETA